VYVNKEYGFEIELPGYWWPIKADIKPMSEVNSSGEVIRENFQRVTITGKNIHQTQLIRINVVPTENLQFVGNDFPHTKITENEKYVFFIEPVHPLDPEYQRYDPKEIEKILNTFSLR